MTIGETIRKYRAQAGMSQTALAEKIGVTQQQIEKWENGKRRPKLDALKKIAAALKIPVTELI